MRIYIPGPPSADQEATLALLEERNYRVFTSATVASPKYYANHGERPSAQQMRVSQANELLMSDAAVITDELEPAYATRVVEVCRFIGVPVVRYEDLPLLAPGCGATQHVLDALDLCKPVVVCEEQTLSVTPLRAWAERLMDNASRAFNARFGWFFTNGNKVQHRVHFKLETKPMTTT